MGGRNSYSRRRLRPLADVSQPGALPSAEVSRRFGQVDRTTDQKLQIIEESFQPGETVSSVARRRGVAPIRMISQSVIAMAVAIRSG
jgi:transposase-like protein